MSDTVTPHQQANLARKALKLEKTRQEILQSEGQHALDMILGSSSPATLVVRCLRAHRLIIFRQAVFAPAFPD